MKNFLICLGVAFLAAIFVAPQAIKARRIANQKPASVDWIGHPVVSDNAPFTPSQGWLPTYKIGFRSDGVVVWTNLNSTTK